MREGGYDVRDHQAGPEAPEREQMGEAGWEHRRRRVEFERFAARIVKAAAADAAVDYVGADPIAMPARRGAVEMTAVEHDRLPHGDASVRATATTTERSRRPPIAATDRTAARTRRRRSLRPGQRDSTRASCWASRWPAIASTQGEDRFLVLPGDDVKLTVPDGRHCRRKADISDNFTIVDFYESKMSEYDASFVFVPIRKLQELRGMIDPTTGIGMRQRDPDQAQAGRRRRRGPRQAAGGLSARSCTASQTWRDKQGPLLAAVQMETAILNVLLFLIIAVAGFGILAIFYMIVVEKTRDIGILKSLGASGRGVMGIFLAYGLSLGLVGSGVGTGASGCCSSATSTRSPTCWRWITGQRGVRSVDLLLLQDSDDRRAADGRLDRGRGAGDRRAGQRSAGPRAPPGCIPWRPCAMSERAVAISAPSPRQPVFASAAGRT